MSLAGRLMLLICSVWIEGQREYKGQMVRSFSLNQWFVLTEGWKSKLKYS